MHAQFQEYPLPPVTNARQRETHAMKRALTALAVAYFRYPLRTSTGIVEQQATALGLDERDLAWVNVEIERKPVVLGAVPTLVWHDADAMRRLHELKAICSTLGEKLVLVPQAFITRQPRLDNAMMLVSSRSVTMPMGDRMAVLGYLIENGSATLVELAGRIRHPDPVNALMSMVTSGMLDMNLDRPILPHTLVTMGGAR